MENYYFLIPNKNESGTPIYLDGTLQESFIEKKDYIKNSSLPPVIDSKDWRSGSMIIKQMPSQLFLINKQRLIDFDFYPWSNGFIISEYFKKMMDDFQYPKYKCSNLEIINREGKINSKKRYFFLRIIEDCQAINFEKSIVKEMFPPIIEKGDRFPSIFKYGNGSKIIMQKSLFNPKSLFFINQSYIGEFLFCGELFKDAIIREKMKTISYIPIENLFDYLSNELRLKEFSQTKFVVED